MPRYADLDQLTDELTKARGRVAYAVFNEDDFPVAYGHYSGLSESMNIVGSMEESDSALERLKQEGAREIFGQIEDLMREWFDFFRQADDIRESCAIMAALSQISELKKKYTEGET